MTRVGGYSGPGGFKTWQRLEVVSTQRKLKNRTGGTVAGNPARQQPTVNSTTEPEVITLSLHRDGSLTSNTSRGGTA